MFVTLVIDLGLRKLHSPARIAVLWRSFAGLSFHACGMRPALISVALPWRGDDSGTHDLPAHREMVIETGKQVLHRASLHEMLTKKLDALASATVLQSPKKPRKRMDESGLGSGTRPDRIIGRASAPRAIRALKRLGQRFRNIPYSFSSKSLRSAVHSPHRHPKTSPVPAFIAPWKPAAVMDQIRLEKGGF